MEKKPGELPMGSVKLTDLELSRRAAIIHKSSGQHLELVKVMIGIAKSGSDMTKLDRDLIAYGLKALVTDKKRRFKELISRSAMNEVDAMKEQQHMASLDLRRTCQDIIALIDEVLLPAANTYKSYAFYKDLRVEFNAYLETDIGDAAIVELSVCPGSNPDECEEERKLQAILTNIFGVSFDHAMKLLAFWRVLKHLAPEFSLKYLLSSIDNFHILERACNDSRRCAELIFNPSATQVLGDYTQDRFWECLALNLIRKNGLNQDLFVAYAQALEILNKAFNVPDLSIGDTRLAPAINNSQGFKLLIITSDTDDLTREELETFLKRIYEKRVISVHMPSPYLFVRDENDAREILQGQQYRFLCFKNKYIRFQPEGNRQPAEALAKPGVKLIIHPPETDTFTLNLTSTLRESFHEMFLSVHVPKPYFIVRCENDACEILRGQEHTIQHLKGRQLRIERQD